MNKNHPFLKRKILAARNIFNSVILYLLKHKFLRRPLSIFLSKDLVITELLELSDYLSNSPGVIYSTPESTRKLFTSEPVFNTRPKKLKLDSFDASSVKVIVLEHVEIIGASDLILLADDTALFEPQPYSTPAAIDYKEDTMIYLGDDFCVLEKMEPLDFYEEGIFLLNKYSFNYYHFLFEIAPKFKYLNELNLNPETPIFLDEVCRNFPQFIELVSELNTNQHRIIYLPEKYKVAVIKLWHITKINFIAPNFFNVSRISAIHNLFDFQSLTYLTTNLTSKTVDTKFPARIFISRENASSRRKFNEEEVWNLLEKYEFAKVFPENLSIKEQIHLFGTAKIIVSGSGAALSNLLFSNPESTVIILTNYKIQTSIFSCLAATVKNNFTYLYDTSIVLNDKSFLHESFTVDLVLLDKLLKEVLENIN